MNRYDTNLKKLLPALLFSVVAVGSFRNLFDSDVWWHLASGRWMWEHHQILRADPFSYTVWGHPSIDHEWFFQVMLFGFYGLGKIPGVLIGKGILLGVSAVGLAKSLPEKLEPGLKIVIVLGIFYALRFRNMARADLVSLCLIPWYMAVYFRWIQDTSSSGTWTRWKKDIGWLTAGMILWVNSHGGFLMIIGVTGIGALAWFLREARGPRRILYNPFAAVCVLYAAAAMINPYGWRLVASTVTWTHQLLSGDGAFVTEYTRTPFHYFEIFWVLLALSGGLCLIDLCRTKKMDFFSWGWLAYAGWAGHLFVRNVAAACFILAPLMAWKAIAMDASSEKMFRRRGVTWAAASLCAALLVIESRTLSWGIDTSRYPLGGAEFIAQHLKPGPGFNDYNFGGYLIWRFYGQNRPIYLDSRLQSVEGYREIWLATRDATDPTPVALDQWKKLTRTWGWSWALVRRRPFRIFFKGQPVSIWGLYFPAQDWALVYEDSLSALYVRRTPDRKDMIQHYEMPNVYPDAETSKPLLNVRWEDLFKGGLSGYSF